MAGQPEYQKARTFLMMRPNATPQELMEATGCQFSTARQWLLSWRRENGVAPPKVPKTPNPRPPLRVVRTPVDEMPEVKREELLRRLLRMHSYIDQTNDRLINDHARMKPSEHAQLTAAIKNITAAAQQLCDGHPGLSALAQDGPDRTSGLTSDDLQVIDGLFGK